MGWLQSNSKDKELYKQAERGNVEAVVALCRDGAGLEWKDKEGRTPLILACMRPDFPEVVKVLIDLGANVNARNRGSHVFIAGTPLHHAAHNGFVKAVELLLANEANPLSMNDRNRTPLDMARSMDRWNVVRVIESRICLFAGWLRSLEDNVQQSVYRKIWAVILPSNLHVGATHPKYKLAIYSDQQAAQPNPVISLWKVQIKEPAFNQPDPVLVIVDEAKKKQYKFLSENEGDKQQLQLVYSACTGIPQHNTYFPTMPAFTSMPSSSQLNPHASATSAGAPPSASEDVDLAMAIHASIQSAIAEGVPLHGTRPLSEPTTDGRAGPEIRPSVPLSNPHANQPDTPIDSTSAQQAPPMVSLPLAPPMVEETVYAGPIHYPSIDSSPVDLPIPTREVQPSTNVANEGGSTGSCVICLDAPAEGACIPCGHKAGCMSCLKKVKAEKGKCPVCRKKLDKVMKIYDV